MQYILTQEERDALVPKGDLKRMEKKRDVLVQIALAMLKVIDKNCLCVHDPEGDGRMCGYCDDCPLAEPIGGKGPQDHVPDRVKQIWANLPERVQQDLNHDRALHKLCGMVRNWSK